MELRNTEAVLDMNQQAKATEEGKDRNTRNF